MDSKQKWRRLQCRKMESGYSGPDKLQVEVCTSLGRTGLHFLNPLTIDKMIDEDKIPDMTIKPLDSHVQQ